MDIFKTPYVITVTKIILIGIFVISLISTVVNFFLWNSGFRDLEFTPFPFNEAKEVNYVKYLRSLPDDYKQSSRLIGQYPISRNFFAPLVKEEKDMVPFYLKDVVYEPLFFMYMGHIEKRPSEYIAQINWADETYFVRKGESIKEWKVKSISKDNVTVENAKKEEIELPLYKRIFSKKPYAIIIIRKTKKELKINVDDVVEGYKVLDITKDTVVLSIDSKAVTITK